MARVERKKIQQQDLDSVGRKAFEVDEDKSQVPHEPSTARGLGPGFCVEPFI